MVDRAIVGLLASIGMYLASGMSALAQVIPDGTLSSTVSSTGNNFTITNGDRVGNNLFHSFSQFSIPTGGSAWFNNAPDVQNIFSRVTGGKASNIDGLIRANGNANLFLLNPAGILFGANAQLNLGGSFIGTTASSILFADGVQFSATPPQTAPLLTISVPIGLQMGRNPGAITVQGFGHNLTFNPTPTQLFPPFTRESDAKALRVQPGKTLALVGGDISLAGGQLLAEQGRIELGSVESGQVNLSATDAGFALSYPRASNYRDIRLAQAALLDASGTGGGIHLTGRNVALTDGSTVLMQNGGATSASSITVKAVEALEISGTTANGSVRSSLTNEAIGAGAGGAIQVSTQRLTLQDGGQIITRGFGTGNGGDITIDASKSIDVIGSARLNPFFFSSIFALTPGGGLGQAGDIDIATGRLRILQGGIITTSSFGLGSGGNLTLFASDLVEVAGSDPVLQSPSDLNVATFQAGNAGNMTIQTQRLLVRDGAKVRASTLGSGNAGSLTINARQRVEVSNGSAIESSVNATTFIEQLLGVATSLTGKAGGITLNTDRLVIQNQAKVTVENIGPANGGTLQVNAGDILLDRGGTLTASTKSGEGGNIFLRGNSLIMRHGSLITTNAGGNGNGGNITMKIPVIAGVANSDIAANAVQGRGGNIQITAQALFGLQFRPQLTLENDITASSQFGVVGTVQVDTIGSDPHVDLVELPADVTDSSQQMTTGCAGDQESSFVATGRGGIPQDPTHQVTTDRTWNDIRDLSAYRQSGNPVAQATASSPVLIQASTWRYQPDGTVELIAEPDRGILPTFAATTCSGLAIPPDSP
ncbi:MAG: filamentous hemagglutinin N-terminal domain-containing protein [Pantanalinema sp. GBBB05]|nr:filamentous hemagglutinin N-terminal domain-containing protein [Pantanalinema sp. GBBB05]